MRRDDTLFVRDIIAAMQTIEQFVQGLSLDEFKEDDKTSSAVIAYFGVDYQLVWDAIKLEIPELKPRFQKILTELEKLNSQL